MGPIRLTGRSGLLGYVFGYGSLVAQVETFSLGSGQVGPEWGTLSGHRRRWNLAIDNAAEANDGKHFIDATSGMRPAIRAVWLNIEPGDGPGANGVAIPVDGPLLGEFDRRETSYDRLEVTGAFSADLGLPVWTYRGAAEARRLFEDGLKDGTAVVSRAYVGLVRDSFEARGPAALAQFEASTDELRCPMRDLRLVTAPV